MDLEFLDKLGVAIASKSKDMVQKTKDVTEVIRLNSRIAEEEAKVKSAYMQLGQLYMQLHREEFTGPCVALAQQVDAAMEKISGYQAQVNMLKGLQVCPCCSARIGKDDLFCPRCGAKIPQEEVPHVQAEPVCQCCSEEPETEKQDETTCE